MKIRNTVRSLAFITMGLILSGPVSAALITFNGQVNAPQVSVRQNKDFIDQDFILSFSPKSIFLVDSGFTGFGGLSLFDDDALNINKDGGSFTIKHKDGLSFDFLSMWTGTLGTSVNDQGNVLMAGTRSSGETVSLSSYVGNARMFQQFSQLTNLVSLTFSKDDFAFPVLDDLNLALFTPTTAAAFIPTEPALGTQSLPEGNSVWLFATGALFLFNRRQKGLKKVA